MMKSRDYQIEAVDSIYRYFQANIGCTEPRNPVLAMPTGTGKSVVIAAFLKSIFENGWKQKTLILTHVKELVEQNYLKLLSMWPEAPAGVNSAGLNRRDYLNPIIFAGIASVAANPNQFGFVDLVIIDEAHLLSPKDTTMYQKFLKSLLEVNPKLKIIGLTATPWRLGHGSIVEDSIFTHICFDITGVEAFNRLIAEGYLSPLIPRRTELQLDLEGVHIRGGEFIEAELQSAVNRDDITERAILEALPLQGTRKSWLTFCTGVDHAITTANMMRDYGIQAGTIHSKMSNAERDETIYKFKTGQLQALTNNNVLTTGFDHPQIDLIIGLRPTLSAVLWVQMLGRGTRPVYASGMPVDTIQDRLLAIKMGGKANCLVLDFAANSKRLGPINDPVVPRKKGKKSGPAPVKECPVCKTINHAKVRFCVGYLKDDITKCSHEFSFDLKLKQGSSDEELLRGDLPVTENFKVDHITYDIYTKVGSDGPMMKVNYYCGIKMFTEYVCFEHKNYAGRKAKIWWSQRSRAPFPENTMAGIKAVETLDVATHISVWTNKPKWPEIMACCFDGSCFGQQEPNKEKPQVNISNTVKLNGLKNELKPDEKSSSINFDDFDDDIPF